MMRQETDLYDRANVQIIVEEKGTFSLARGESVLSVLRKENLVHFSNCGGRGTCGKCVIRFLAGAPLPQPGDRRRFSPDALRQGYRLACLARPQTDCRICCEFGCDDMRILTGTSDFVSSSDSADHFTTDATADFTSAVDATADFSSDSIAASHSDPATGACGNKKPCFVAIDVGTTTIVMQLVDAVSGKVLDTFARLNPQRRFGADVISRMQASVEGEQRILRELVAQVLTDGMKQWILAGFDIKLAILAGNTVMVHLFMGWNVEKLAVAPFTPAYTGTQKTEIYGITTVIIPGVSAFVGGDITAGILTCRKDMEKAGHSNALLVDLGTNGEMALMRKDTLYVTATAAGPAFEGGLENGVYGADVIRMTAELLSEGVLDETGLMCAPYFEEGVRRDGILLTQKNIRDLQMAKAAVYAGIRVLLLTACVKAEEIDRVYLAGGFGYFLDVAAACRIGVLPAEWEEKTEAVGNTALKGAILYGKGCFLNGQVQEESLWDKLRLRRQAEEIGIHAHVINLAQTEAFEPLYLSSMTLWQMGAKEEAAAQLMLETIGK